MQNAPSLTLSPRQAAPTSQPQETLQNSAQHCPPMTSCEKNRDLCLCSIHWECSKGVAVFAEVHLQEEHKVCMLQTQAPV